MAIALIAEPVPFDTRRGAAVSRKRPTLAFGCGFGHFGQVHDVQDRHAEGGQNQGVDRRAGVRDSRGIDVQAAVGAHYGNVPRLEPRHRGRVEARIAALPRPFLGAA